MISKFEFQHFVAGGVDAVLFHFLWMPVQTAFVYVEHRVLGQNEGKFCDICWNLRPFDAPLC